MRRSRRAEQVEHAVWYRHHLPYNIDRVVDAVGSLDTGMLAEKRRMLASADGDYSKAEKRAARRRLRAINRAFAEQHAGLIATADAAVGRARQGVVNADIACRRDWCFAFYPPEKCADLRSMIADFA